MSKLSRPQAFLLVAEAVATHNKPSMSTMSVMRGTRPTPEAIVEVQDKLAQLGIHLTFRSSQNVGDMVDAITA